MSTYANKDGCTDIVLDFIAGGIWGDKLGNPIGESDGCYDAVIGHVHGIRGVELSTKTIDQVYGLMTELLDDGEPSTAAGRYQVIRKTLQTLQASKGLPGSTLFTPKLQDSLALSLMIGRGYQRWWIGQMSDADFAHGLSCEWASLPDPRNSGESHYDGVGPNHASTTLPHVLTMLAAARAAQKAPAAETPVADAAPAPQPAQDSGGVLGWIKNLWST